MFVVGVKSLNIYNLCNKNIRVIGFGKSDTISKHCDTVSKHWWKKFRLILLYIVDVEGYGYEVTSQFFLKNILLIYNLKRQE